jgi:DNA repair exonuclease SbcCD ATPase subunit
MKNTDEFRKALEHKKLPLLVLDQKWHRLFAIHGKTDEIRNAETELNNLLARQGKLNSDLKDYKKVKNQLMDEIVQNMEGSDGNASDKEKVRDKDKRMIDELNERIDAAEAELLELPQKMKQVNENLMILSMEYFYAKIKINTQESKEIEEWINQVRIDLKKNIIKKQNRDINNREIYAYLHDICGPQVLDLFDVEMEASDKES